MTRKGRIAVAIAVTWLAVPAVRADDHLVTHGIVGSRLSESASERAQQLSALDGLLASPRAARVAGRVGVDVDQVRRGLAQLSDNELRDLSHRAAALGTNPAAGHEYDDAADLVVVLLIVAVAAAVAIAIANHA